MSGCCSGLSLAGGPCSFPQLPWPLLTGASVSQSHAELVSEVGVPSCGLATRSGDRPIPRPAQGHFPNRDLTRGLNLGCSCLDCIKSPPNPLSWPLSFVLSPFVPAAVPGLGATVKEHKSHNFCPQIAWQAVGEMDNKGHSFPSPKPHHMPDCAELFANIIGLTETVTHETDSNPAR